MFYKNPRKKNIFIAYFREKQVINYILFYCFNNILN